MNIPFLIIRRDKTPHVSRACLPEALCMSGDNVKNKASQHFLQPGQIFGAQDRQPQLRLDSEGLQRKPWPQGHCQAAGLPFGLLCWELTVTASMEFCSSSQSTSSTFTLCTSPLQNSLPSTVHHTDPPLLAGVRAPPGFICYLALCWENWAFSLLPQQPQGFSSPPQARLAGSS